jgi:hypothetical protein
LWQLAGGRSPYWVDSRHANAYDAKSVALVAEWRGVHGDAR